jgi:hypothetical protein
MEHYNVIIMTPGYNMEGRYVISLLATVRALESQGISWAFSSVGFSDVAIARENTVLGRTTFGLNNNYASPLSSQATYDKLFLIDSDIYWESEDFLDLYYSEYDLVSGIYLQSDGETTTVLRDTNKSTASESFTTGIRAMLKNEVSQYSAPFEISGAGLGFMCIKRGVFEAVERPWFEHGSVRKQTSDTEFTVEMLSEDISFLRKVGEAGFKIYADPRIKVGHVKKTNLDWY